MSASYLHVRRKAAAKADKTAETPADWNRIFEAELERLGKQAAEHIERGKKGERKKRGKAKFSIDTSSAPVRTCGFGHIARQNGDSM